jgi:hypothetical protein
MTMTYDLEPGNKREHCIVAGLRTISINTSPAGKMWITTIIANSGIRLYPLPDNCRENALLILTGTALTMLLDRQRGGPDFQVVGPLRLFVDRWCNGLFD